MCFPGYRVVIFGFGTKKWNLIIKKCGIFPDSRIVFTQGVPKILFWKLSNWGSTKTGVQKPVRESILPNKNYNVYKTQIILVIFKNISV